MLNRVLTVMFLGSAVALAGCSSKSVNFSNKYAAKNSFGESLAGFEGKGSPLYKGNGPIPKGGGRYHVGKPYQVAGNWFTPKEQPNYDKTGVASWYGEDFHRLRTSNGEYFDMNAMTAAHPTLPLPSYARVTNVETGRTIVVRINDRGPFVGTRIIDLSKKSADTLGFKGRGKATVRVQWIGNAPLDDKGLHLAMMNRKAASGASMRTLIAAADGPTKSSSDFDVAETDDTPKTKSKWWQEASYEKPEKVKRSRGSEQVVLVGSFRTLESAEQARASLSAIGPVQVYEWESDEGPLYRVQLGPFRSEVGAEEALQAVQDEGYPKAVLSQVAIEDVAWRN
jgi:rare lipoprotein A